VDFHLDAPIRKFRFSLEHVLGETSEIGLADPLVMEVVKGVPAPDLKVNVVVDFSDSSNDPIFGGVAVDERYPIADLDFHRSLLYNRLIRHALATQGKGHGPRRAIGESRVAHNQRRKNITNS
jgi:hypothetical protein